MKIFVSNQLEILAQALKEELFQSTRHPFAKKWVIVPNERVKQELFLRWAEQSLIAAGFKMITWSEALSRLFPQLPNSTTELSLKIEKALDHLNEESLLAYLNHGGTTRKASLCDKMSFLFLQYLTLPEEKLMKWLEGTGWQQSLWRAVFGEKMPWEAQRILEGTVYLFNPSQLSLYQFEAFKKMDAACFLFSPCAMYWGDFHTFSQQRFLLKQAGKAKEELAGYFENEHPLLANWGRKGRELLTLFEDEELIEAYQELREDSLLKTIQKEMLTLSAHEKKKDTSIQIHSAPSKFREVEVVWEIIQRLPFEPREISVLAPDMESYAAMIELIFRERGGPFDFAIFGLEARSKSPLIQGLEDLLDLPRFRFSKESVEKLLFCPPFLKRFSFDAEEARLLQRWMGQVHVRYDLKADHPGTWEAGLTRLVESLVTTAREDHLSIDFSEADLLSRWIGVIKLFETALLTLEQPRSLKEWSKTLRSLMDIFFEANPDDPLMREFEKLQEFEVDGEFHFSSIERILNNMFQQKSGAVQGTHLQAVRFSSLENGALIPAKAVILMGMEEGNFPRQDFPCSLQELPVAGRIDEDKHLFLEALCSAREMFILTYTRLHPEDGKRQKACPLIDELHGYCGEITTIEHPFSPFDPFYFQGKGFQSYSPHHFPIPHRHHEKKVPTLSEITFTQIDIRCLKKLARHPLQFFFEERLGIDFEWKDRDTEFVLSPLDMARLRKGAPLQEMQEEGKLPVGSFAKIALQKIHEEVENYHEALNKLQVKPEEIYSIELKAACSKPTQIDEHRWIYPAMHFQNVVLQGKIDDLCPQGLLFHGDESLQSLLKVWPLYLIAKILFPSLSLLLTKKGKVCDLKVEHPRDALERYIAYAKKALSTPSPLHPAWARSLLKEGKIPELTEEDEVLQWAGSRSLLPRSELWIKSWTPYLEEAVRELL